MKQFLVFFLVIASISSAQFPLGGNSYLFLEGGNKNAFGLLEDISPRKAIQVQFVDENTVNMAWANLDGMYFSSTLAIAEEIERQFKKNSIMGGRRGSLMNDPGSVWSWEENLAITAKWSCKEALQRMDAQSGHLYNSYGMTGRIMGVEKTISRGISDLSTEATVFDDRPECWLQRSNDSPVMILYAYTGGSLNDEFFDANVTCSKGWCALATKIPEVNEGVVNIIRKYANQEIFDSAKCKRSFASCRSRLVYESEQAQRITDPSGLFIVHLFPQVLWRPRNTLSGGVHAGVDPVSTAEMRGKRVAALADNASNDLVTAGWRSPLVDQSVSTVISFQIRKADILSNGDLVMEDPKPKPKWTHTPKLAPNLHMSSFYPLGSYVLTDILAKAFSYGKTRQEFMSNVSANCGTQWATIERNLATMIYGEGPVTEDRVNELIPYCYSSPSDEANALTDGREKLRLAKNQRPCVLFSGSPVTGTVKRWKLQIDPTNGRPYDLSNFIWRGCPDAATDFWIYNPARKQYDFYNRNQLLELLSEPYERCDPQVVANACRTYDWIYTYTVANPSIDWSKQIRNFADQRRKTACPDVKILRGQLDAIKNPRFRPTTCRPDPFFFSIAAWPRAWTPTIPMAAP